MRYNLAKWKELPRRIGFKSAVHRWCTLWVKQCVFDSIMRDMGELVEERGGNPHPLGGVPRGC